MHVALIRMVVGCSGLFCLFGLIFFVVVLCLCVCLRCCWWNGQVERGRLAIDEETSFAAANFLNLCHGTIVKRLLFGFVDTPDTAEVKATVASAVRMFLKAYGTRG